MAKPMNKRERSMFEALDAMGDRLDDAMDARDRYWLLYAEAAEERENARQSCEVAHAALHDAVHEIHILKARIRELEEENEWQQNKASDLLRATAKPFSEIEVIHGEPKL